MTSRTWGNIGSKGCILFVACCAIALLLVAATTGSAYAAPAAQEGGRESDLPLRLLVVPDRSFPSVQENESASMPTQKEASSGTLAKTGDCLLGRTTASLMMVGAGALAALLLSRCHKRPDLE